MLFVSMVTAEINPVPATPSPPPTLFLSVACHMVLQVTSEGLIWNLLNAGHVCVCVCE